MEMSGGLSAKGSGCVCGLLLALCLGWVPPTRAQADDLQTLLQRADAAWKAGDFAIAESAYRKAIEAEGDSARAHARLASFYLLRDRPREAIGEYQAAILRDPENARLFVALAVAYLHERSYAKAHAMLQRALELDPNLANARKLEQYMEAKRQASAGGSSPGAASALGKAEGPR